LFDRQTALSEMAVTMIKRSVELSNVLSPSEQSEKICRDFVAEAHAYQNGTMLKLQSRQFASKYLFRVLDIRFDI